MVLTKKKLIRICVFSTVGVFLFGALFVFGIYYAVAIGVFGKIPSDDELRAIRNYQASDLYSADGVLMGRYFVENRSNVNFEEIAPHVTHALIATEDVRFYEHKGIDQRSLMRVLFKTILLGQKSAGGGSTLSQQLAKNLFGRGDFGFLSMPIAKIKEGIIANKLNDLYTKEEILTLYLNTVSIGEDTYGIETACERFFSTTPKNIKIEEAAVLIGMLKAPTTYNPRLNPEKARERRNTVLAQMKKYKYISEEEFEELSKKPLDIKYKRTDKNEGLAAYFREHIRKDLEAILATTTKNDGSVYNLYTDGLKVYTTIDSRIQLAAEKAMNNHLEKLTKQLRAELKSELKSGKLKSLVLEELKKSNPYKKLSAIKTGKDLEKALKTPVETSLVTFRGEVDTLISPFDSVAYMITFLQSAYLAMNPQEGNLLAWVGGINYKHFPYDRTFATRQLGSVFKPLVYAKALENGHEICDKVKNEAITYTQFDDWSPKNSNGVYGGKYSLIGALTNSVNTVSVQLLMEHGIKNQLDFCKRLGIEDSLPAVPSMALGTANIPLQKVLEVYSVFANNGKKQPLYYIEKITTADERVIYQHKKEESQQLVDSLVIQNLTQMLESVVDSGTAQRLRTSYGFKNDIAGKTGTTQNQTDGWFVGYTPTFLAGVWTGADNPQIRFASIKDGQGANMALPIWAETFQKILKKDTLGEYYSIPFSHNITIDCDYFEPEKTDFIHQLFKRKKPKRNETDGLDEKKKKFKLFGKN